MLGVREKQLGVPYRILGLSGGGIRGVFQAKYLMKLEKSLGEPLASRFDLVAGTSTGAIIALAISLGIPAERIFYFFKEYGSHIFPTTKFLLGKWHISLALRGPLYSGNALRGCLEEVFNGPNGEPRTLKECKTSVVVPATTLNQFKLSTFTQWNERDRTDKRPGIARDDRDENLHVVDVALASAAGPTFFSAVQPRRNGTNSEAGEPREDRAYVDGGLWANNPCLAAVMVVHRELGIAFHDMRVVSLGNGEFPDGKVSVNFNRMRNMFVLRPLLNMMFATQAEMAEQYVKELLDHRDDNERFLRINTPLGKIIELDDVRAAMDQLPAIAETVGDDLAVEMKVRKLTDGRGGGPPPRCHPGEPPEKSRDAAPLERAVGEDDDVRKVFYAFLTLTPLKELGNVQQTLVNWVPEPNALTILGVYDVYGSVDIIARFLGADGDCVESVRRQISDKFKSLNKSATISPLNVYRVDRGFVKRDTSCIPVDDEKAFRGMRAFIEIELTPDDEKAIGSGMKVVMTTMARLKPKGVRLLAFDWCKGATRAILEFYVHCGGYHDLGEIVRSIEGEVWAERAKRTFLAFSAIEKAEAGQ